MRLIDADELKKHIRRCDDSATRVTFDFVDEDDIDDAPTVDVLEQIRAEIEELDRYYDNDYFSVNNCPMYKCNEVLLIIDKYKGDKE